MVSGKDDEFLEGNGVFRGFPYPSGKPRKGVFVGCAGFRDECGGVWPGGPMVKDSVSSADITDDTE